MCPASKTLFECRVVICLASNAPPRPPKTVSGQFADIKPEQCNVMSKQVIEHAGVPVGIAVPDEGQLRFIAVKFDVFELDQRRFESLSQLQGTIRSHLLSGNTLAA